VSEEQIRVMLQKVEDAVGEHAHAFLIVAWTEDETGEKTVSYKWDGGRVPVLGLIEHIRAILQHEAVLDFKRDKEEGDE
jgi:hypothetical protein